jgi:hypothetical protein
MYKFLPAIILFFCNPLCSIGQPFIDIVNLKYQIFPAVNYSENSFRNLAVTQFLFNLNLPVELKNKDFIITGGTYDQLIFKTSEAEQKNLYAFNLQIGYLKNWKGTKWQTLLIAIPKISSDMLKVTGDAFQQGGALLFIYEKRSNLKYKFGLYYNREFFGNFFMPLAGIEWTPTPKLNVFGVLPGSVNLEYRLNKKLYTGLSYQSITSSYRLHGSENKSFVRNGDRFWGHNQVRAFINFYLIKNLVIFTEVGYTFWRKFEAYQSKKVKLENSVFRKSNDGFFFNAGIAFRIRLDH